MSETERGNTNTGFGPPNPGEISAKEQLAAEIGEIIRRRELTQEKAAKLLDIPLSKLSSILRGRLQGISEAEMLEWLTRLGHTDIYTRFSRARIEDRLVDELTGLCQGVLADGTINQLEAEFIQEWLQSNYKVIDNPLITPLYHRIYKMLADSLFDSIEQAELMETLVKFVGGAPQLESPNYATTLPFSEPQPAIEFPDKRFCFTGTFAHGTRNECEDAVILRGASIGGVAKTTDYLVIGVYVTDSWIHSSHGRKIEKAVEFRNQGAPLHIVSETHWTEFL